MPPKFQVIEVRNLTKIYQVGKKALAAVQNVSFAMQQGEILGLVGESGSGKSTLAKILVGLIRPTSGQFFFEGQETRLNPNIQIIFQDPFSSLNPRMTVADLIDEPLKIHRQKGRCEELLDLVGLPQNAKGRFPHEFSGGQRQRIGIARALALSPKFLICDEPISSLDISIQAQIVNLLCKLQKELSLTYLFIAHDLAMVRYISTRVAVMYLGEFVESAPTQQLFSHPLHPYTQLLLASIPKLDGTPPPPQPLATAPATSTGCPFAPRCPHATARCRQEKPLSKEVGMGHFVSCHLM